MKHKIVIIDDHIIFIQGLSLLIESDKDFSVTGSATNSHDGLELIKQQKPDLVIVDLNLGDEDGLELIKSISVKFPKTKVLVLSMMQERYYSERCLAAGAKGYVMKDAAADTVIRALKTVLEGKIWLSEDEQKRYIDSHFKEPQQKQDSKSLMDSLSDRQLQIMRLIGQGNGTLEIAQMLSISTKTVDAHKEQLKKKLNCSTSQELLRLAISWNK
ncbi:MAG: response regulator transcription factor [Treponema sp.]|uniref:response regulator transcription factor n=1 Tax=Treponema sp. TaxID=166 RepID=UPI001B54B4F3|nr:response regulator transcription factor [Treponema sp.]MBP5588060.1 response regulator transcription factor [Treponema sp.]MCR5386709.1 response regulator transcription factor [Treponema sp.]